MHKKRILVVDDDAPSRLLLEHFLKHDDHYIVDVRKSGRDALDYIHDYDIDLVISDVEMDDITGFDLCQNLLDDEQTSDIPVILQSVRDRADIRKQSRDLPNVKVVAQKPYLREQLLSDIETILSNQSH